jgi:neuronal calcium sensor 1
MGNQHQHKLAEDLSLNDYRYLIKQTHLTPQVIQGWYREFMHVCPNGQLNKEQFKKFYGQLTRSSTKNIDGIAVNVFRVFDRDGQFPILMLMKYIRSNSHLENNRIDFKEFLIAYALTSIGEPIDKLQYTFSLFDKDKSDTIDPTEMSELVTKFLMITGNHTDTSSAQSITQDIFRLLDRDHNRSISKEEFINGCLKSDFIRQALSPF